MTLLKQLTLEEKVGQVIMGHIDKVTDPAPFVELIQKYHLGGIIFFASNLQSPEQIRQLTHAMQAAAKIPLFIASDEEGGRVSRLPAPATRFPNVMALGAIGDEELAERAAKAIGDELKAVGINVDFAPVVDVNVNPLNPVIGLRSYGEVPEEVGRLANAQIRGFQAAGVASSLKHFPGHGDTAVDSHIGLPVIEHDRETLEKIDLKPFKMAFDSGVEMVMIGHLVVPALDPARRTAIFSKEIVTDLLRNELGFEGIAITDALNMEGAYFYEEGGERLSVGEQVVYAFEAGFDILLMPSDIGEAHAALVEAVRSGRISEERLDQSVARILKLKENKKLFTYAPAEAFAHPDHQAIATEVVERSLTLVKGEQPVLAEGTRVAVVGPEATNPAALAEALAAKGRPAQALVADGPTATAEADYFIALVNSDEQAAQVAQLLATGKPVAVVAVQSPYSLSAYKEAPVQLATYGLYGPVHVALARLFVGELEAQGKLPVTLP